MPWPHYPRERAPSTHLVEGWVGRRIRPDTASQPRQPQLETSRPRAPQNPYHDSLAILQLIEIVIDENNFYINIRDWEFFSSPPHPDRLWSLPNLLFKGYQGFFPWGKAAGA